MSGNPCFHFQEIYPRGNEPEDLAVDDIVDHMVLLQTSENASVSNLLEWILGFWMLPAGKET